MKIWRRLGVSPGPVGLSGPVIERKSISGNAGGVDRVEFLASEGLKDIDVRAGALLQESDRHGVGTGLDRDLEFDAFGNLLGGSSGIRVAQIGIFLAADGDQFHARAIEGDFDAVGELETAHGIDRVGPESDFKAVLGVEREIVFDENAAASADGQTFDVLVLRSVGADRGRFEWWA